MNKHLKIAYIPYNGKELNDKAFSKKFEYRWTNILKKKLETEGHSIHTYDIIPIEEADVILCFDNVYFQNNRFFKRLYDCKKLGCTTHIDYEPPSANCRIHSDDGLIKLSKLFKSLITYNDNVINNDTIIKGCIGDFFSKEVQYKHDFKNRKFIAIIANFREPLILFSPHPDALYRKRAEAVEYFQEKCPKEFDLYGDFWPEDLKKCHKGILTREEKMNKLPEYKFLISYDSITNQNGYISEKIFDCFKAKIVPVYWGADNVTDYIPADCFIDKRNFKSYEELYNFLKNITEEEYENYIKAIEKFLTSNNYKKYFSSEASANIIYNELTKPKRKINYHEARSIIKEFEEKRVNNVIYNYSILYYDYRFPTFVTLYDFFEKNKEFYVKFIMYINNKFNIEIYTKSPNQKYKKIKTYIKKENQINNANFLTFNLKISDILKKEKVEIYIYNNENRKFRKLTINNELDLTAIHREFNIYIKKNFLYVYKTKREKFKELLKKLHVYKLAQICNKILHLPYRMLRKKR